MLLRLQRVTEPLRAVAASRQRPQPRRSSIQFREQQKQTKHSWSNEVHHAPGVESQSSRSSRRTCRRSLSGVEQHHNPRRAVLLGVVGDRPSYLSVTSVGDRQSDI